MGTHSTTVAREIIAEPEAVWSIVSDVDRWPKILTSVDKIDRTEGTGMNVGASWIEERTLLGARASQPMRVTEVDEPRSFTLVSGVDGATLTLAYRAKPSSLGTRLEVEATLVEEGRGRAKLIAGGGGLRGAKAFVERDLDDFVANMRT